MKKFWRLFVTLSLLSTPLLQAHELEDETYYTEDDDELFNKGKFVGQESDEYQRLIRRERYKNWAIAIGSAAVGITTVVLVGKNHEIKEIP